MRSIIAIGLGLLVFVGCGNTGEVNKEGKDKKANAAQDGSLTLVRESRGEAVIVVGKQPTISALFGAQELQEHVRKITGASLPIVCEGETAEGKRIYVGESEGTRQYGLTNGSFAAQEYAIRFVPEGLILMGRDKENMHRDDGKGSPRDVTGRSLNRVEGPPPFDEQGTCYAVYDFLEKFCDVRWYAPKEIGLCYPQKKTLTVSGHDVRRKPACMYRQVGWLRRAIGGVYMPMTLALLDNPSDKEMNDYERRLKAGGINLYCCHSFYGYYDRFWKKNPKCPGRFEGEHPEFFARNWPEGYKEKYGDCDTNEPPSQMCYSNPDFIKQVVQDARDYFDGKGKKPGAVAEGDFFSICPMDNRWWCLCADCQKQLGAGRKTSDVYSTGEASNYMIAFANKVAREIKKSHPGKWITILAYASYALYPTAEKPEDNIAVQMCFGLKEWPASQQAEKNEYGIYKEWLGKEKGKRPLSFWFYYEFPEEHGGRKFHVFPGFCARYLAGRLKEFADNGILGAYLTAPCEHPDFYISMKMLDDPSQNSDEMFDEYFERYYGAAAEPMRKLYLRIEAIYCDRSNYPESGLNKSKEPLEGTCPPGEEIAWKYLGTEERMAELGRLMEEAKASAKTDMEKKRVALFEKGVWEYMVTGRKHWLERGQRENVLTAVKKNPPAHARVPKLAEAVNADLGKVDWTKAGRLEGWRQITGLDTKRNITGWIVHDGAYLYIKLEDHMDPAKLIGNDMWDGDNWEIFIARARGKLPYYQFAVNRAGKQTALVYETAVCKDGKEWDSGMKVLSDTKASDRWTVFLAIPMAKLAPEGIKAGQKIYANFCRTAPTPMDLFDMESNFLSWSPNLEENFHNLDRLGELIIE